MALLFGGYRFPLDASGGAVPQPFTSAALPYLQDCLNAHLSEAFEAAVRGKVQGATGRLACQETGIVDVSYQLTKKTFRLPYLCLALDSGVFSEGTARWDQDVTRYQLSYVLPALPEEAIQEVAVPLLGAVAKLLSLLIKQGGDPNHRSGARVWEEAEIVAVRIGAYQLEFLTLGSDMATTQRFPLLRAEVFVTEQEGYDQDGPALVEQRHAVDLSSDDGVYPSIVETILTPLSGTPPDESGTEIHHDRSAPSDRRRAHVFASSRPLGASHAHRLHAPAGRLVGLRRRGCRSHAR